MGDRRACCWAENNRASKGAMSLAAPFNGLPGETSHQTSSSPSACIAARLIRRCALCAGLKDPPRSPMRAIARTASTRPPHRIMWALKGEAMVGEFEAIGDAITGGVVGRAVEPKAGEGADGHTQETKCLNCDAELIGSFCHACGQHAHVHRTLTAFFHDFLHGVLHFEGKIWRTLPLLAWKPGDLTRRYIDGQRASFISPVALFLFCVFLMFAAVSLMGSFGSMPAEAKQDLSTELSADRARLAVLEKQRAGLSGKAAEKVDDQIGELKGEMKIKQAVQRGEISPAAFDVDPSGLAPSLEDAVKKAQKNPELVA